MTLQPIAIKLTSKILKDLQIRDWMRLKPELYTTISTALCEMYIKGRNHERDGINWELLENGDVFINKSIR